MFRVSIYIVISFDSVYIFNFFIRAIPFVLLEVISSSSLFSFFQGIDFALICLNSIVLPTVQHWLRKLPTNMNLDVSETACLMNFKHCCGNLTDLIVCYFQYLFGKCIDFALGIHRK